MATSETLASLHIIVSQRLQALASSSSLLLLHRSQWRCLASSYAAVTQALIVLLQRTCSVLGPLEQESMWGKPTGPLDALHQAVLEAATCLQELLDHPSSSTTSKHSWLLEKALKLGMSTDIVDLHLQRLLWTSSVVREQILRCAPIDGMELLLSEHTGNLCEIWSHVDAEDDLLSARTLLNRIMGEEEGDTRQLASFILQKLSCSELSGSHGLTHGNVLPPFLWTDSKDLTRIADALGEGGYGQVQEAVWLGGHFAVKDFFYIEDNVAFGREATIQAQLHHPNLIPLVCCSQNPLSKKCSLVMELMQQDLRVFMMRRMEFAKMETPFPLLVAVDLMLQISLGMEYLHSDGLRIMHRDLKSSNILVSFSSSSHANGVTPHVYLKVADFGMAKAKYESSRYTTRQVGATPWRAPEVFEVSPEDDFLEEGAHPNARYTNKADVYSFAMVCYEILTGKAPFEGTSQRLICRKVLSGERPSLPRHCPLALSSYIARCWHADPDQRPTFTQICRMLRYLKACIFLQDHDHQHKAEECNNWLLHPLSTSMCARVDDMLQSLAVRRSGGILRPQLLVIPLEMYCCRVVIQEFREEIEAADQFISSGSGDGIHEVVAEDQSNSQQSRDEIELVAGDQSTSVGLDDLRRPARGSFNRALRWLKKLFRMRGTHRAGIQLRNALGLMGEFTYEDLRIATNNFSSTSIVGVSIIGEGISRKVYRGQLMNGQRIAVKVQRGRGFERETFIQELRIASQLRHRNIVPLLGCCLQVRDNLLLVYEYMPNGDLDKHIFREDKEVFGWRRRYKVVRQLAAALKYLHQDSGYRQIVHRNVKTSNILLDSEWNARLADCGIAVLLEEGQSFLEDNGMGTSGYVAPETVMSGTLSPASDVFSFGVTILEIATGRRILSGFPNDNQSLLVWVSELYQNGEVLQAADARLARNFDELEMRRLLVLGLACTNDDPNTRPTIEDVLMILSTASDPPPPQSMAFSFGSEDLAR